MSISFKVVGNSLEVDAAFHVPTSIIWDEFLMEYIEFGSYSISFDWNSGAVADTYQVSGSSFPSPTHWTHSFDVSSDGAYLFQFSLSGASSTAVPVPPYGDLQPAYNIIIATHAIAPQTLVGLDIADVVFASNFADTVSVLGGNNRVYGRAGNDVITTGSGIDLIDGGSGADTMIGGAGEDFYYVDNTGDQIVEDAGGDLDTVFASASVTSATVENLNLTGSGNISATGGDSRNVMNGNSGNNTLSGQGGGDVLDGKTGADVMIGGDGNDTYYADNVGDTIIETADGGDDHVWSKASFSHGDYVEGIYLLGSASINGTGGLGENFINGTSGQNMLSGGDGNDSLGGNAGDDTLDGGVGNDVLYGGAGNDVLVGGADADTANYAGRDAVVVNLSITAAQNTGGGGIDALSTIENLIGSDLGDTLTGDGNGNVLDGGAGTDMLDGGAGDDIMRGGGYNDTFRGGVGADHYDGGGEVDTVNFSQASGVNVFLDGSGTNGKAALGDSFVNIENVLGGIGADFIVGEGSANQLVGNNGNDILWGRAGNDRLEGGTGDDRLLGQQGNDVLTGGSGVDTFAFTMAPTAGEADQATDFMAGLDRIEIDASMFGGGLVAGGPVQLVSGTNPSSADFASGVFLYNTFNGFLSWDADGQGAGAALSFFRLLNPPTLTAANFSVVA